MTYKTYKSSSSIEQDPCAYKRASTSLAFCWKLSRYLVTCAFAASLRLACTHCRNKKERGKSGVEGWGRGGRVRERSEKGKRRNEDRRRPRNIDIRDRGDKSIVIMRGGGIGRHGWRKADKTEK
jgi:hypothetical protein